LYTSYDNHNSFIINVVQISAPWLLAVAMEAGNVGGYRPRIREAFPFAATLAWWINVLSTGPAVLGALFAFEFGSAFRVLISH
jgi:hypothetical protein